MWQTEGARDLLWHQATNRLINVFLLLLFQGAKGLSASETNGKRSLWRASLSPPNETNTQRKHSGGEKAKSNLQKAPRPLAARPRGAGTRGCVSPLPAPDSSSRTRPWPALTTRGRSAQPLPLLPGRSCPCSLLALLAPSTKAVDFAGQGWE